MCYTQERGAAVIIPALLCAPAPWLQGTIAAAKSPTKQINQKPTSGSRQDLGRIAKTPPLPNTTTVQIRFKPSAGVDSPYIFHCRS